MNKLLSGLIIMLMPLAISNISFSSNYGELNSTLDTLVVQQGLMIETTDVFLKDIESIKIYQRKGQSYIDCRNKSVVRLYIKFNRHKCKGRGVSIKTKSVVKIRIRQI